MGEEKYWWDRVLGDVMGCACVSDELKDESVDATKVEVVDGDKILANVDSGELTYVDKVRCCLLLRVASCSFLLLVASCGPGGFCAALRALGALLLARGAVLALLPSWHVLALRALGPCGPWLALPRAGRVSAGLGPSC